MTTTSQTAIPANLSAGRARVGSWTVTPSKTLLRSAVDRVLRPYFTELTQQLTEQLRQLGLYAADTTGDGNCLFRALSDQLYGTESRHHQLRKDICDWIQSNSVRYAPFVDDERGLDVHLSLMRQQGETPPLFYY